MGCQSKLSTGETGTCTLQACEEEVANPLRPGLPLLVRGGVVLSLSPTTAWAPVGCVFCLLGTTGQGTRGSRVFTLGFWSVSVAFCSFPIQHAYPFKLYHPNQLLIASPETLHCNKMCHCAYELKVPKFRLSLRMVWLPSEKPLVEWWQKLSGRKTKECLY